MTNSPSWVRSWRPSRLTLCALLLCGSMTLLSGADIIWITANTDASEPPTPDDIEWNDMLIAAGHTVTRMDVRNLDTNDAALADMEAADLVIMSRDTNSGDYTSNATEIARWNGITTPVILMSAALARSTDRLRWFSAGALVNAASFTIQVAEPGHPLFAGITLDASNQFEIADIGVTNPISTTTAGNGTVLAREPGTNFVWIASWPANAPFYAGGPPAGGPRIFFAAGAGVISDNPKGGENFTADGERVFRNAVNLLTNSGTDSDFDGLADTWEATYFNDLSATASGDPDSDGLTNLAEQNLKTNPKVADTDADGLNDKVETDTGTYVSPTNTGTNPIAPDTDRDGLLDGVETKTGSYVSPTNTGSSPLAPDTDSDTMPDGWEVGFAFNPVNPANGPLDFDTDGLSNAGEFSAGTNPTVQDSDADGLRDGVETKTGTFVSPTNTGTDPARADTDLDGLVDGVETATGTFVDATHTGTNPHTRDSDGDKFIDGEDLRRGFNPSLASSHPPEVHILFIGANTTPTFGADGAVFTYMETRFGLGNVTYTQASATSTGDELAHDVLVISSTPASADMRNKFQESTVPILNWEEAIADNNGGEFGLSASQMSASVNTTMMNLSPHPITAGLPAQITYTSTGAQTTATSNLFPGLTSVATAANGTINELLGIGNSMVDNPMVFVAEAGQDVDPGSGISDATAHARRVYFPMRDGTFAQLTADGRTLFGQALDWAAGLIGKATSSIQVVDVDYVAHPTGPDIILKWASQPGRTYSILGSLDLAGPRDTWIVMKSSVPSGGAETTGTITVSADTQKIFLVVKENP